MNRAHPLLAALAVACLALPAGAQSPSLAEICTAGYAAAHRMPPEEAHRIKRSMLPPGTAIHDVVLDHICPLEIGCGNERENLQLQPVAEAKVKDRLEHYAHHAACAGTVPLAEAQAWFLDWRANLWRINGGK